MKHQAPGLRTGCDHWNLEDAWKASRLGRRGQRRLPTLRCTISLRYLVAYRWVERGCFQQLIVTRKSSSHCGTPHHQQRPRFGRLGQLRRRYYSLICEREGDGGSPSIRWYSSDCDALAGVLLSTTQNSHPEYVNLSSAVVVTAPSAVTLRASRRAGTRLPISNFLN